jgi:hypothetical protein
MELVDACAAIDQRRCAEVSYRGEILVIEVHACGTTVEGHPAMRVWQVRGGTGPSDGWPAWKLMLLDAVTSYRLLEEASKAPRPSYYRGDPVMQPMRGQV